MTLDLECVKLMKMKMNYHDTTLSGRARFDNDAYMQPMYIDTLKKIECVSNQQTYTTDKFSRDDPYQSFLYALRAPETKRQYPKRLKVVFDYLV